MFGEVARRNSSAVYTSARASVKTHASSRSIVHRKSTLSTDPTVTASASAEPTGVVAADTSPRFRDRAAAVKKFMGGAAIGGVPRTLAPAYTEREELVPITEGKFGKAFDLQAIEAYRFRQVFHQCVGFYE